MTEGLLLIITGFGLLPVAYACRKQISHAITSVTGQLLLTHNPVQELQTTAQSRASDGTFATKLEKTESVKTHISNLVSEGKTNAAIARLYNVHPSQIGRFRKEFSI